MQSAKINKAFAAVIALVLIGLIVAVAAICLPGSDSTLPTMDNTVADTGSGADTVSTVSASASAPLEDGKVPDGYQTTCTEEITSIEAIRGAGGSYYLTKNIELTSLDTSGKTFSGTLDGNGKIITIKATASGGLIAGGLFSKLSGTVKNVTIEVELFSFNTGNAGQRYIGIIAGVLEGGTVDNVKVVLKYSPTGNDPTQSVGSVAAYFYDNAQHTGKSLDTFFGGIAGSSTGGTIKNTTVHNATSGNYGVSIVTANKSSWGSGSSDNAVGLFFGCTTSGTTNLTNVRVIENSDSKIGSYFYQASHDKRSLIGVVWGWGWSESTVNVDGIIYDNTIDFKRYTNTAGNQSIGTTHAGSMNGWQEGGISVKNVFAPAEMTWIDGTDDSIRGTIYTEDKVVAFDDNNTDNVIVKAVFANPTASTITSTVTVGNSTTSVLQALTVGDGETAGGTTAYVSVKKSTANLNGTNYNISYGNASKGTMNLGSASFTENREDGYYSSREYDGNAEAARSISLSTGKTIDNAYVDNSGLGKNVGLHTLAYNADALGENYKLVSYAGVNYIVGNDGYVYSPDNISINGEQSVVDVTKNQLVEITQRAITLGNASGNITYGDDLATVQSNNIPQATQGTFIAGEYVESCVIGEYVQFEINAGNEEVFAYTAVVIKDASGNDVTGNYDISYSESKAAVKQRIIAGTLSVENLVYDNAEKVAVFTAAEGMGLFNEDKVEISYSGDRENVTVEGFTAIATVPKYDGSNSNYTFESGASISENFVIFPYRVTITAKPVSESNTVDYSGGAVPNIKLLELFNAPQGLDGTTLFLNFATYFNDEPATAQYAGSYTVTATLAESYMTEEGETVSQTNYVADSCDTTLTIKAKDINVSLSDVSNFKTYDGEVVGDDYLQTMFVVDGEVAEGHVAELEITVAEGEIKNEGVYNISVALPSYYDKMYAISSTSITSTTYTVNKVVIDGEITAPEDSVYDGTEKYATFSFAEGCKMVGNDEIILTYTTQGGQSAPQVISAGTYTVSASLPTYADKKSNYTWASEEIATKNIVINKATVVIQATGDAEKDYNKSEFTDYASLFTAPKAVDGMTDLVLTYTVSGQGEQILNAGEYTITATLEDNGANANYTADSVSVNYTVKVRKVVAPVVSEGQTFSYDGKEKTLLFTEDEGSVDYYVITGNTATAAGNYMATATLPDKTNTCWNDEEGTSSDITFDWSIAKKVVDMPVPDEQSFIFNGQSQTFAIAESADYTVSGNVETNAGDYKAVVTLSDKTNTCWNNEGSTSDDLTFDWSIAKKTVVKPEGETVVSTGESITFITDTEDYTVSGETSGTDAGQYTVTVTLKDTANTTWADGTTGELTLVYEILDSTKVAIVTSAEELDTALADDTKELIIIGNSFDYETALTVSRNVEIDLNGNTLTVGNMLTVDNAAVVTVKDGKRGEENGLVLNVSGNAIKSTGGATFTADNIKLDIVSTSYGIYAYNGSFVSKNGSTISINSGNKYAIMANAGTIDISGTTLDLTSGMSRLIYNLNAPEFAINDSTVNMTSTNESSGTIYFYMNNNEGTFAEINGSVINIFAYDTKTVSSGREYIFEKTGNGTLTVNGSDIYYKNNIEKALGYPVNTLTVIEAKSNANIVFTDNDVDVQAKTAYAITLYNVSATGTAANINGNRISLINDYDVDLSSDKVQVTVVNLGGTNYAPQIKFDGNRVNANVVKSASLFKLGNNVLDEEDSITNNTVTVTSDDANSKVTVFDNVLESYVSCITGNTVNTENVGSTVAVSLASNSAGLDKNLIENIVSANNLPEGYVEAEGVNVEAVIDGVTYVYNGISKAITESDGKTSSYIKLLDNLSGFTVGDVSGNITIDLNGFNVVSQGTSGIVVNGADTAGKYLTLVITNSSQEKQSSVTVTGTNETDSSSAIFVYNNDVVNYTANDVTYKNVTLSNITFSAPSYALGTNGLDCGGVIVAENCKFIATGATGAGAYLPGKHDVTFTNCEISGATGIYVKSGTLDVNESIVTATGEYSAPEYNGSGFTASGSAIVVDSCVGYKGELNVSVANSTVESTSGYGIELVGTSSGGVDDFTNLSEVESYKNTFATAEDKGFNDNMNNKVEDENVTIVKNDPVVNPVVASDGTLYTSSSMPEITTTVGDTEGTIEWVSSKLVAGTTSYTWKFTPADTDNYETVTGEYELTVEEVKLASIDAVFNADENEIYSSAKVDSLKQYLAVSGTNNDGSKVEVIEDYLLSGIIKAGKCTIKVSVGDVFTTFEVTVVEATVTKIEVTVNPDKTVYNAFENFDTAGMVVTATYEDCNSKEISDYTVEGGDSLRYGTDKVTVKFGDCSAEVTVTVNKIDYDMSGISFEDTSFDYDGKAHTLTLNGTLPTGLDGIQLDVSYNGASVTNVADGTVQVVATFTTDSDNYNVPVEKTAYISINAKVVEITWSADDYTYNGEVQSVSATYNDIDGMAVSLNVEINGEFKNAGAYTATASFAKGETNYALPEDNTAEYTIGKLRVSIVANGDEITYGEQIPSLGWSYAQGSAEFIGDDGIDFTVKTSATAESGVGEYETFVVEQELGNYEVSYAKGNLVINAKEITVSWTGEGSAVYSGEVYEPAFDATALVGEDVLSVSYQAKEGSALTNGKARNAGSYTATVALPNGNYVFAENVQTSFEFTIEKVEISATVVSTEKQIEYGTSYEWNVDDFFADVKIVNSSDFTVQAEFAEQDELTGIESAVKGTEYRAYIQIVPRTLQGSYVENDDLGNFCLVSEGDVQVEVKVVIVAKKIIVSAQDSASDYNGNKVGKDALLGMFGIESETGVIIKVNGVEYESADMTSVKAYTVTVEAENGNYELEGTAQATYTVNPKTLTVVWGETEFVYDGTEKKPVASVETGIEGEEIVLVVNGAKTDAGQGYVATASMSVINGNYVLENATTEFSIAKATFKPSVTVKDWTFANYTEENAPVIADNPSDGAVTYVYSGTPNDGSEFAQGSEIPFLAGNYTLTVSIAEGKNYEEATCSTTFAIGKATVLTPVIAPKAYTGGTLTADVDVSPFYTVTENEGGKAVGKYNVKLTLTDSYNYKWSDTTEATTTVEFEIVNQVNEWLTQPTVQGWTYGESANQPVFEAKFGTENAVIEYRPVSADDSEYSEEEPSAAGEYYLRVTVPGTADYGVLVSGAFKFTIAKADYNMSGVKFEDASKVYNGTVQSIAISGTLPTGNDGIQVTVSYSAGIKNAGSVDITATFATASENYNVPEALTATLTVTPKTVTISGIKAENRDYTGDKTVTLTGGVISGTVYGESVTYSYRGEMETPDAGENKTVNVTVQLTGDNRNNYTITQPTGITVNISPAKVKVVWGETVFTYNGSEQIPSATVKGVNGETVVINVSGGQTDAGTGYVAIAETDNANYELTDASVEFTVEKAASVIDVSGVKKDYVYNGNLQTVSEGAILNHGEGTLVYANNTFTTVAEGDGLEVEISVDETKNYFAANVTVTITVEKADYEMSGVKFEDASKVYNGETQSIAVSGTLPTGKDGVQVTVTYTGGIKNVGSCTVKAIFATESENYNVPEQMQAELTITAKPLIATVTAEDKVYDGTTAVNVRGTLSGVIAGDTVTLTVSGALADKNAGENKAVTVTANISGASAGNYSLKEITGVTVKVIAKQIAVVWGNTQLNYNGVAQAPSASAETGIDGETVALNVSGAAVQPGTYTATATTDNANYTLTNDSVQFTIVQNTVTVNSVTVGYGELIADVEGGNEGVEYSVNGGAWTALSADGKITVQLAASWSVSFRYSGQTSASTVTVNTTAENVERYLEENLSENALENKDVIDAAMSWLEVATGDKTQATADAKAAADAYNAAVNTLKGSVENACKVTANLTTRQLVAIAAAIGVSGIGLAVGAIVLVRKGGKKNENK